MSTMETAVTLPLAAWTGSLRRSVLRQMISVVSQPGILSFAGGLPDPQLFPAQAYADALAQVIAADPKALQYGPPSPALKRHIVELMAARGVHCTPEQIFITTGAQQGLNTLTQLLLNPGDEVMLESIVYSGAAQVVAPYQPQILSVPTDLNDGIDVEAVAAYLADGARPAYLYVIPDAHNPLGVSISPTRRRQLAALARQYQLPIIEDDPYGHLFYGDGLTPPLRALDADWVFYLGSFSKILAPALRLGWVVAPPPLLEKLAVVKESSDLESSALTQRAAAAYLDTGALAAHLAQLRAVYGRRRDTMLAALDAYFPEDARWTEPQAGMFIWVTLPEGVDTQALLETAVREEKVAFIPGHAFAVDETAVPLARRSLRLNFSNCTESQIEMGIKRLAAALNRL